MGRYRKNFIVVVIACSTFTSLRNANAQCVYDWRPGDGIPGTDGKILAATTWDPDGAGPQPPLLVVGGTFIVVDNVPANNIAAWNGTNWIALGAGMGCQNSNNCSVDALTVYNGKLIAGGTFSSAGGIAANHIAEWNGTTWAPLGNGMDSFGVYALAIHNGHLIAGGQFEYAGNAIANNVAQWDGNTWARLGIEIHGFGYVDSLTTFNGDLIVGGNFDAIYGVSAANVARWNGTTWSEVGNGVDGNVHALTVHNGNLVAGGFFVIDQDTSSYSGVVQWDGTNWSSLGSPTPDLVSSLAIYLDDLVVGGSFFINDESVLSYVARWDGRDWLPLGTGMGERFESTNEVRALTVYGDNLIAGGKFAVAGDTSASSLAQWNGSIWSALGVGFNDSVYALTSFNNTLIAGGAFTNAGGNSANGIAQWNGSHWIPLGTGMNGWVLALAEYQGHLIAGGWFDIAGGESANYIAQWDGTSWAPLSSGMDGIVRALTVYKGKLIAVGSFYLAGGTSAYQIAQWDGIGWSAVGMGIGVNTHAYSVTVYGEDLIVGGTFHSAGGANARNIASWNGSEWAALGSGISQKVECLAVYQGNLIAVGGFSIAGGMDVDGIAQWNGSNWSALGELMSGTCCPYFHSLTAWNGSLLAGGSFFSNGVWVNGILAWDGEYWSALGPGVTGDFYDTEVRALAEHSGDVAVGGNFIAAGSHISAFVARYGPTGPAPTIIQHPASPAVCLGSTVSLRSTATGDGTLSYQWRKNGVAMEDEDAYVLGTQTNTLTFVQASEAHDASFDCVVKLNDCTQVVSNAAILTIYAPLPADGNDDGLVDARDIAVFVDALVNFAPVSAPLCAFDLTGEGIVTPDDIPPFVTRLLND